MLKYASSEALLTNIRKIKQQKTLLQSQLKDKINKNSEYLLLESQTQKKLPTQKIRLKRQQSIGILEKKLIHKKNMDQLQDHRLSQMQLIHQQKKQIIEKKLQEMHYRNHQRIEELKEISETVLKKITNDIAKNQNKEKKLKQEYDRLKNEEKKIGETKQYQQKAASQEWKVLLRQKWKIQNLVKEKEQQQEKLIREKSPIIIKKEKRVEKTIEKEKSKQIPLKEQRSEIKLNPKEIGNNYLEQVKKMTKETIKERKPKKKLMNLNLKVIGYCSEIMEKIYRNTGDLSAFNTNFIEQQPNLIESKEAPKAYQFQEDVETQKYLKQIKANIEQIQRNRAENNPELIFSESNGFVIDS